MRRVRGSLTKISGVWCSSMFGQRHSSSNTSRTSNWLQLSNGFIPTEEVSAKRSLEPNSHPFERKGAPIKKLWQQWSPKPSKVKLAEALWPAFERKIARAIAGRAQAPPLAQYVDEAYGTAMASRRIHYVLRAADSIELEEEVGVRRTKAEGGAPTPPNGLQRGEAAP